MPLVHINQRKPDNTPLLDDDEQMHFVQPNVSLFFKVDHSEGVGTLFVTTKRVIWLDNASEKGFAMDFHFITCHAVARAHSFEGFAQACLYCQFDTDADEFYDARFVPEDASALDNIYKAFSEGAALNPDPIEETEGDFYFNEEEVYSNPEVAERMQHFESVFNMPTPQEMDQLLEGTEEGQFDDADEEMDE
jgi:hypothetical protein